MSEHADMTPGAASASPRRKRRWLRALGWTALGLVMLAATLYAFGGMWVRTPEMRAAYDAMVARGEQPKLPSRLVVPIPGCVCHSDDPVLQAQHARRRIRECSSCH
ncbi:MAG: hypothetical protein H5T75_00435 [Coriobacteriia bacterium]|nr:hypothetical protein [Coriobacteriia bacterium]